MPDELHDLVVPRLDEREGLVGLDVPVLGWEEVLDLEYVYFFGRGVAAATSEASREVVCF